MKRFLAGMLVGMSVPALIVFGQQWASQKVVEPQVLVDTQKVKIVRWVLNPGEGTPLHTHTLDHVAVVLQGSVVRDVESDGKAQNREQKTGDAVYVPGTGRTHSFANTGKTTLELISSDLK